MRTALAIVASAAAVAASPASAAEPCWRLVITDGYDGRIDRIYEPSCYAAALERLPGDAEAVRSVRTEVQRGLAQSLAASPAERVRSSGPSSTPALIVIVVAGAFVLLSSARMLRARRQRPVGNARA